MRLLFITAAAMIAVGLVVSFSIPLATPRVPAALPSWYYATLLAVFGVSGALLYLGGRQDLRAQLLGLVFLLFGSLFTERIVRRAIPAAPPRLADVLSILATIHLTAFAPLMFWQFAWRFPRIQPTFVDRGMARFVTRLALAAALVLVVGNLVIPLVASPGSSLRVFGTRLAPNTENGLYWKILALLVLPSLTLLAVKFRATSVEERRRLAWVVVGIAIGTLPMVLHVLLVSVVPPYAAFAGEPYRRRTLGITLTAFSLAIPATTAYAVVVDQVLGVRFVIRRAVQYALARYTVLGVMAGLVAAIAWVAYGNRARPLQQVLSESPASVVVLPLLAAVLFWRRSLLAAIDRHFFREQYHAQRILVELVDKSQKAQTSRDLMRLIIGEVDRALHLERVAVLIRSDDSDDFRDPEDHIRDLATGGPLGLLIAGSRTPLDVDLSSLTSPLGRLPQAEREWLADAGARLIVPLFGARGVPIGILTLGDKRSELPFTLEDRQLMIAVAASAALALEQKLNNESPDPDIAHPTTRTHAGQCVVCGRVQNRQVSTCHACGGAVQEALLPAVLAGKFEIERQIGAGGMGVVYRARDLALNRSVALKVLPRFGPEAAARLRREARAMALMQHPNLAVIHAMESWRGAPVLVLEYLAGGTLADRLRHGPLPLPDLIESGTQIADVLRHVHAAGFLHGDVKPRNIGYTAEGTPKLLDFGLVRLVAELSRMSTITKTERPTLTAEGASVSGSESLGSFETSANRLMGTPAYMSPEAITLESPSQSVDLWGLAVTLYEA